MGWLNVTAYTDCSNSASCRGMDVTFSAWDRLCDSKADLLLSRKVQFPHASCFVTCISGFPMHMKAAMKGEAKEPSSPCFLTSFRFPPPRKKVNSSMLLLWKFLKGGMIKLRCSATKAKEVVELNFRSKGGDGHRIRIRSPVLQGKTSVFHLVYNYKWWHAIIASCESWWLFLSTIVN